MELKWQASPIWDGSGEHPRNHWACFRRSFDLGEGLGSLEKSVLRITADSRYILYVNGEHVGFGPVRSWPFEQSYDSYDVKRLLQSGDNVIAVLVTHFGISTFQYIEGRALLFAQLDLSWDGGTLQTIGTDGSWKTRVHEGYDRASVRISCQQAWAEIFDAGRFDGAWNTVGFDDSDWASSVVLGKDNGASMAGPVAPVELRARDIPHLTEEPVYPRRVLSLREVEPVKQHISVDLRPNLYPAEYDANPKSHLGYLVTTIKSPRPMSGKIGFPFSKWVSAWGDFKLAGTVYGVEVGVEGGGEVEVRLKEGDNLFLMNVSGHYHEFAVHMAFDFDDEIMFEAPLVERGPKFITVGPFDKMTTLPGHQDSTLKETADFRAVWQAESVSDLEPFRAWVKPVLDEHICAKNVYTLSTKKRVLREYDVPFQLQNMVIASRDHATVAPWGEGHVKTSDVEIIVDFGRELSGFIEFDVEAAGGEILDFYLFESMHDGIIEHTDGLNNTLRYVTKPGRQVYRSVQRRGFRYMMLTARNLTVPLRIYSVKAYLSSYPVAEVGEFSSSDYLLNRIWEISRDTTQLCMEDTYVDCPAYEQTFWVGDSRNEALINYYTFGAYPISRRCLRLVAQSMSLSALPESQVPSGWRSILTAWALLWMSACKEYYEFTGDSEFAEEIYPSLMEAVRRFRGYIDGAGLLSITAWNMLDWAPMDTPPSGIVTHQNALLVKALRDVAYLAGLLGREDDRRNLLGFAEDLKVAINRHLWSDEEHAYIDSIHSDGTRSKVLSEQTNVIVYLCDCAEGERKRLIEQYLIKPPGNFVKIGSPFMSFFYFEALQKLGRIDLILDNIRKNWGAMLDYGATTCWETFSSWENGRLTRSHCHAWSAAPGYFLGAYLLGVRPVEPGFKKMIIQPDLCGLRWLRGSVPTPQGRVDVLVREHDDSLEAVVRIPEGTSASVVLPAPPGKQIRFDGRDTAGAPLEHTP